jgi:hypothetical protein
MHHSGKARGRLNSGKRNVGITSRGLVLAVIVYLGTTADAQAYVDPNAAGLIFQILTPILALIAAGWAALRMLSARWLGALRSGVDRLRARSERATEQHSGLMMRLWGRLVSIAVTLLALDCMLFVTAAFDGWLAFLRPWEAALSVAWHVGLVVFEGIVVGTLATILVLPVAAVRPLPRRAKYAEAIFFVALVGSTVVAGGLVLRHLFQWSAAVELINFSQRAKLSITLAFCCILAILLIVRRWRTPTLQSLEATFNGSVTRRTLVATGLGAAAATLIDSRFAVTKAVLGPTKPARQGARNIVLITFDTLGAQHMSLYGNSLPTTPNIEAFAKTATTFTNFYSCSTFTTPSIAACLTGRYPSETQVYQVSGFLRGRSAERNLARELRAAGYFTAASVTNPFAHPDHLGIGEDFLLRPGPPQRGHPLSKALIHVRDPLVSNYAVNQEALLLRQIDRFVPIGSEWPPGLSFEQGKELLSEIGSNRPFFLWIHVLAPHGGYKPAPPYLYRFLPEEKMLRTQQMDGTNLATNRYTPDWQPLVDKRRLRYAEFIAECDGAFADFMSFLDSRVGQETAVIVSSDHGESFTGGVFSHGGPDQVRQIVHIPLIARIPGRKGGDRVTTAADQTSLAPTILEIAGVPRPTWMRGPTLFPEASYPRIDPVAFTQHFELNSIFEPIRRGTVGIIDGVNQFVVDLETKKGILRPLSEADSPDADHSKEDPALATELRRRIFARFPNLSDDIG